MSAGLMLVLLAAPMVSAAEGGGAAKEREALKGSWILIRGEADGQPLREEEITKKQVIITFLEDKLAGSAAGKSVEPKLSYKLDLTQTPRAIDITPETAERGTIRGIFQLDGDRLRICLGEPGKERPKKLEARPGSGHKLMELKRTRP